MAALEYAARLARGIGASLTLVHVVEPYAYPEDLSAGLTVEEMTPDGWEPSSQNWRICAAEGHRGHSFKIIVTTGPAWHQIVDTANSLNVDLIITGTHGYTGLTPYVVLGSTAEQIIADVRGARCWWFRLPNRAMRLEPGGRVAIHFCATVCGAAWRASAKWPTMVAASSRLTLPVLMTM